MPFISHLRRPALVFLAAFLLAACGERPTPPSTAGSSPDPAVPGTDTAPLFTDATDRVGLDFHYVNGMSGEYYFVEMTGGGGAFFDLDNDGDLDLFLVQGHMLGADKTAADSLLPFPARNSSVQEPFTDRLYRNELVETGQLRFTDITAQAQIPPGGYGMGVVTGDIDNDGFTDLYITNFGPNRLLRNRGDGTFEDITAASGTDDPRWSVPAVFFDLDRDGFLDLYVGNYVDFTLATHKVCPDESGAPDYCGPLAYEPEPDRLLRNRGDGTFEDITGRAGPGSRPGSTLGAIAADFNNDGWPDLYLTNDQIPNELWIHEGNGNPPTFREEALLAGSAVNRDGQPEASMGVDAADVDNDGDEDLFMAHLTRETNTLYRNDGTGLFDDTTAEAGLGTPSWNFTGFGTAFLDYDRDGWLDVAVVNGAVKVQETQILAGEVYPLKQSDQLFRNRGDGTFEEVTAEAGAAFAREAVSRGVAVGDVDNDGDADLLVINNDGAARLLLNEAPGGGWLGLKVVGNGSHGGRDMLGARVTLHLPGGRTLHRQVKTAGSYLSAHDPRVLFGLGDATEIEKVTVRWPDGTETIHTDVPVGAYTTLTR
jgi:hypothetical protein